MAHDINTIIRQKVRAAEQIPVHWEKAQVWKNIKRGPARRTPAIYYAAASIVLVACLVVYFLNRFERESSHQRILALEAAINHHLKAQPTKVAEHVPVLLECETVLPVIRNVQPTVASRRKNTPAILNPTAEASSPVEQQPEAQVPMSDGQATETQPDSEQVTNKPKVEAIIGFIPPPQLRAASVKVKKMKFRFLRENDQLLDQRALEDHSAFVTARIN